jgi:hypothetical protein
VEQVIDNDCKLAARKCLSTCGPGPKLQVLQLYHFEAWNSSEHLFETANRPTVVVFEGSLPSLRDMSLIGVSLPWTQSIYFLRSFRTLELALHAEVIRPSWEHWSQMLRASPGLEKLSLHYSGPRGPLPPVKMRKVVRLLGATNGGVERLGGGGGMEADHTGAGGRYGERGIMTDEAGGSAPEEGEEEDPTEKIQLPLLSELSLTELEPAYLVLLFRHLIMPAVTSLSLDLTSGDCSAFTDYLAGRPVVDPTTPTTAPTAFNNQHQDQHVQQQPGNQYNTRQRRSSARAISPTSPGAGSSSSTSPSPSSLSPAIFPQLKQLRLTGLRCQARSLLHVLRSHPQLEVLEIDFGVVPAGWDVLTGTYARKNGFLVSSPVYHSHPHSYPPLYDSPVAGVETKKRSNGPPSSSLSSTSAAATAAAAVPTMKPVPLQSELFLPHLRTVQVAGLPAEEYYRSTTNTTSAIHSTIGDSSSTVNGGLQPQLHRRVSSPLSPRSPSSYNNPYHAYEEPMMMPRTLEEALVACLARLMSALPLVERWSVLVRPEVDMGDVEKFIVDRGLLEVDEEDGETDEVMGGGERRKRRRTVRVERQEEEPRDDDDDDTGSSDEEEEVEEESEGEEVEEEEDEFGIGDHDDNGEGDVAGNPAS